MAKHYLSYRNLIEIMEFCEPEVRGVLRNKEKIRVTPKLFRESVDYFEHIELIISKAPGMVEEPKKWKKSRWWDQPSRYEDEYTKHQYPRFLKAIEKLARKYGTVLVERRNNETRKLARLP